MWPRIVEKYDELGFKDKAKKELVRFSAVAEKMVDEYEKCSLMSDCAKLYAKSGQEIIAKELFFKALAIIEKLDDPQKIWTCLLDLKFQLIHGVKKY